MSSSSQSLAGSARTPSIDQTGHGCGALPLVSSTPASSAESFCCCGSGVVSGDASTGSFWVGAGVFPALRATCAGVGFCADASSSPGTRAHRSRSIRRVSTHWHSGSAPSSTPTGDWFWDAEAAADVVGRTAAINAASRRPAKARNPTSGVLHRSFGLAQLTAERHNGERRP